MSLRYDWRDLAAAADPNRHRPTEREALLREALRLKAQGLRPRDIAEILGLNPSAVETLLNGPDEAGGELL